MPLSVEDISWPGGEHRLIALSHTAVQSGDLMRDPEIVFALHEGRDFAAAEPVSYRNDFAGTVQEVYDYDDTGRRTAVSPAIKRELKAFCRIWFANLKAQGFMESGARREVLS